MPDHAPPIVSTLLRLGGAAGLASAVVLVINAGKRAELIPATPFTQLVAPLAQVFAIVFVIAFGVAAARTSGRLGIIVTLLNVVALTAVVGLEFLFNLVSRTSTPPC